MGAGFLIETDQTVIETLDLARGARARLIAAALGTGYSIWTVDGKGVVFRRSNPAALRRSSDIQARQDTFRRLGGLGGLTVDIGSLPV